jgi:hypothetical protein
MYTVTRRNRKPAIVLATVEDGTLSCRPDGHPSDRCPRAGSRPPLFAAAVRTLAGTKEWSAY